MTNNFTKHILFTLILLSGIIFSGNCQIVTDASLAKLNKQQKSNFDRILTKVQELRFSVIPEIHRVAIVGFDYAKKDMPETVLEIFRAQLEQSLTLNGFQVVKIPEFRSNPMTYVQSKDSTLRIIHQKPLNKYRTDGDSLLSLMKKYGVQGFVDCNLAYDDVYGYLLNIQITQASTREIVANKLLLSNHEKSQQANNTFFIDAGLGAFSNAELVSSSKKSFAPDCSAFSFNFTWRQAFNSRNKGYYGLNIGFDILQSNFTNDSFSFKSNDFLPHAGMRYYLSFIPRYKDAADYYLEFYQGLGLFNSQTFTLYIEQGINFNISKNLGLKFNFKYLFDQVEFAKNNATFDLGNIYFGLNTAFRF